jgi:DNA-binding GntR family transcriptional regulator
MPISDASRPLYHRVYREIAHEIADGGLAPGDRLPSERWFCDELGVSRATVRRAIEELTADGLVEARGRGTYVTGTALVEPPNTLVSLT